MPSAGIVAILYEGVAASAEGDMAAVACDDRERGRDIRKVRECNVDCYGGLQEARVLFQFSAVEHQKSGETARRNGCPPSVPKLTLDQRMSAWLEVACAGCGLLRATTT